MIFSLLLNGNIYEAMPLRNAMSTSLSVISVATVTYMYRYDQPLDIIRQRGVILSQKHSSQRSHNSNIPLFSGVARNRLQSEGRCVVDGRHGDRDGDGRPAPLGSAPDAGTRRFSLVLLLCSFSHIPTLSPVHTTLFT